MANIFDQFDDGTPPAEKKTGNVFDKFDSSPGNKAPETNEPTYDPAAILAGSEPVTNEGRMTGKEAWNTVVKPTIHMGALTVGGAVGTAAGAPLGPLAPVVGVFGAGLAYSQAVAATDAAEKLMARYNNEPMPDESVKTELLKSLESFRDGMMFEMAGPIAAKTIVGTGQKLLAPGANNMSPVEMAARSRAERQGIKLSPGEATGSPTMLQTEAMMSNAPMASDIVRKFQFKNQLEPMLIKRRELMESTATNPKDIDTLGQQIYKEVNDYLTKVEGLKGKRLEDMRGRIIAEIGSNDGRLVSGLSTQEKIAAESQIRVKEKNRLYDKATEEVLKVDKGATDYDFVNMRETAKKILDEQKKIPNSTLSSTARDWLDWASNEEKIHPIVKERIAAREGFPEIQEEMLAEMRKISPELFSGKMDFESLVVARRYLNKLIEKENTAYQKGAPGLKGQLSPEGYVYTQIKGAIEKDFKNVVESTGGEAKKALDIADAFYVENIKEGVRSDIIKKMAYSDPGKLVEVAFTNNGMKDIATIRKFVGEEKFNDLKGQFTNKITGWDKDVNTSSVFDPKFLQTQLKNYSNEFLTSIYTPQELTFLRETAKKGIDLASIKLPSDAFAKSLATKNPVVIVDSILNAPESKIQSNILYSNILNIKKVVSEDTFKNIGDTFIDKLFQVNPNTKYLPPETFSKLFNKYTGASDYGRNVLEAFGYSKDKIKALKELADTAGNLAASQKLAMNTSKTATNVISWGSLGMILRNPIKGTATVLTPGWLAKLWYSDAGMKYLVDGFKLPAGSSEGVITAAKIIGIISSEDRQSQETQ